MSVDELVSQINGMSKVDLAHVLVYVNATQADTVKRALDYVNAKAGN